MANRILVSLVIAGFMICQGVVAFSTPKFFVIFMRFLAEPPLIYLAAMLRIAIGIGLIWASAGASYPNSLRVFGAVIFIGGVATPFLGPQIAHAILDWWNTEGPWLIRLFGGISLGLGLLTAYASLPPDEVRRGPGSDDL